MQSQHLVQDYATFERKLVGKATSDPAQYPAQIALFRNHHRIVVVVRCIIISRQTQSGVMAHKGKENGEREITIPTLPAEQFVFLFTHAHLLSHGMFLLAYQLSACVDSNFGIFCFSFRVNFTHLFGA